MPKINQEEYEVLKELDDKWKWIARNWSGFLHAYDTKPTKNIATSHWENFVGQTKRLDGKFQSVQWEDEKPHNIAELIEEYEKDYKGSWEHAIEFSEEVFGESEETEVKKDLEWLKEETSAVLREVFNNHALDYVKYIEVKRQLERLFAQLDEPEVLSQEWIEDNEFLVNDESGVDYTVVESRKLKGLLVPKQEEQSAKTVADVIADFYKSLERLKEVLSTEVEGLEE